MKRVLHLAVRFTLGVAFTLPVVVACGSSTEPSGGSGIAGSYDTHWQRTAAVCSPAALPTPTESNLANYLLPPSRDTQWVSKVDIAVADTSLTLTIFDGSGAKDPLGPYIGDTQVGPGVATRTLGPIRSAPGFRRGAPWKSNFSSKKVLSRRTSAQRSTTLVWADIDPAGRSSERMCLVSVPYLIRRSSNVLSTR